MSCSKKRLNCSTALRLVPVLAIAGGPLLAASPAWANCSVTGSSMVCDAAAPDPTPTPVNVGASILSLTVNGGTLAGGVAANGNNAVTVTLNGGTVSSYSNTAGVTNITFSSGSTTNISGGVVTGAGQDRFEINSGTVVGSVQQGSGIDSFIMTGGTIGALYQGDQRDTFFMSGGEIVGAFEDGDVATMTGGIIGRVDMKLDNNIFDMSGGTIRGNLVAGFGNDAITVSNGVIGGNISVSGGTDSVTVSGGSIGGEIRMSTGNDIFLWQGGGTIAGLINMGADNDVAILRNLGDGTISPGQLIDGGAGIDRLVLAGNGPTTLSASGITNFETLDKSEGGVWTLGNSLGGFQTVNVQEGTLRLTGHNRAFAGQTNVDPAGILEGQAWGVTPAVNNNGLVRFAQPVGNDASYVGQIVGAGVVEKTGGGMVTLSPAAAAGNTYSGGTIIKEGVLAANADNAIGGPSGGITLDGGAFRFASSFTLGAARPVNITSNNGGLDAGTGVTGTLTQGITGPGALTKTGDGAVVFTGANTYAGGTTIAAGVLQLGDGGTSGSIVGNVTNNGSLIFNRADTVTFPGVISGSGDVQQAGAGTTVLTANNTYTGETSVERGALAVGDAGHPGAALSGGGLVNVSAGATFGGYGSVAGDIVNNGVIRVADAFTGFAGGPGGNFTIGGVLTNAGHVQIGGGDVGNNLVAGSYVGQNGALGINTVLGGDNSPSDRLVINGGSATGGSSIQVANVGGLGAVTRGNGIQVVNALNGATTAAGAFMLAGPVVAGPYEYSLFRGARDASDPQSWYLRTDLPPTPTPTPTPTPIPAPTPDNGAQPQVQLPNYRQETSLYAALPSMALGYGQSLLGTLHERVGDQELLRGGQGGNGSSLVNGVWARVIGQHVSQSTSAGGIYGRGPAYDQNIAAFQIGLDIYRQEHTDGSRDHAGVYLAIGQSEGNVKHFTGARAGQNRFDAQTVGAYWTHYGAQGWYLDAVAQGTWYNARANSTRLSQLSTDGFGAALSLEAGYPVQLGGGWAIEPQAQLIYQSVSLDSRHDGATHIRFSDVQSLAGRIGARLSRTWTLDAEHGPRQINVWARANLWNEFLGSPKTWFSSADGYVPFRSDMHGSWTQLGGGVTAQLNGNVAVYADASYSIGQGGDRRSWDGKVGIRVNW